MTYVTTYVATHVVTSVMTFFILQQLPRLSMGTTPSDGEQSTQAVSTADHVRSADDASDVLGAIEASDVDLADVIRASEVSSESRKARNDANRPGSGAVRANLTDFGTKFHSIDIGDMLVVRTLDGGIFIEPLEGGSRAGD